MVKKVETRGRPRIFPEREIVEWQNAHGERFDDPRKIKFVQSLLQKGIITQTQIVAAHLLLNSTTSRINACKYKSGVYASVTSDWDNPEVMALDIITKHTGMWDAWVLQTAYYEQTDNHADRASIDRVDENSGYSLKNIQCLSVAENTNKATKKPHYIFEIKDNMFSGLPDDLPTYKRFETKQEAVKSLGVKVKSDNGRIYQGHDGKNYLIQSEEVTTAKRQFEEYELEDEKLWHQAWLPVGTYEDRLGNKGVLRQQIIFPYMMITLKESTDDAVKTS
ncbi:hypothetical protein [Cohnella soli]|uniref:Phage portal protein n=1 Tax=Cohnella soli TaxID=425005 RepID=A0ABW0HJX5_9BACL